MIKNSTDAIILDGIIILLGLTVLTQFFSFLFFGVFSPAGIAIKITDIANHFTTLHWYQDFLFYLLRYKAILGPLLGLAMLSIAVCLILLINRSFFALTAGCSYLVAWILLWHYPGTWTFEFLFPALFGICAGLAKLTSATFTSSFFRKIHLSKKISLIVIILISLLIWHVTYIAFDERHTALKIAWGEAFTFLLLSIFHLSFDNFLIPKRNTSSSGIKNIIANWPLLNIMMIIIGAMMIMQVYADYFTGLYTLKNYIDLVNYYATKSGATWLHPFLIWSALHADILMPLQILFEVAIALFLPLLIFSGPTLILSGTFFGILAFAELGVSATWPPSDRNLTWEWELLLVTAISLLIGFGKLIDFLKRKNIKEFCLGKKIFKQQTWRARFLIALGGGTSLYLVGITTQIFGEPYKIISSYSGITFFILLFISSLTDKYRI